MSHQSPGTLRTRFSDLDRLLSMLDGYDVYSGDRRGSHAMVTIGNLERSDTFTTFHLPASEPFTPMDALKLAPTLFPYAYDLIDTAQRNPDYVPLVTSLLTAMAAIFHKHSDDLVLHADIQTTLEKYGVPRIDFQLSTVQVTGSSHRALNS